MKEFTIWSYLEGKREAITRDGRVVHPYIRNHDENYHYWPLGYLNPNTERQTQISRAGRMFIEGTEKYDTKNDIFET